MTSESTVLLRRDQWSLRAGERVRTELPMLPSFLALGIFLVWAAHDGGYDADTWYWGALAMLALLVPGFRALQQGRVCLSRPMAIAIGAFGLYLAWSYLSIAWAASQGDALTGANRTLLYLLVFCVFALAPWTPRRALVMLTMFALGIGVIGVVLLLQMASGHGGPLFDQGRLESPDGYFNATAAAFTIGTLMSIALSVRTELPQMLRAALLGFACCDLQLALLGQSRGWLFTLPFVIVGAIVVVRQRGATILLGLLPVIFMLAMLSRLLDVFRAEPAGFTSSPALVHAARSAAGVGLFVGVMAAVVGALVITGAPMLRLPAPSRRRQRWLWTTATVLTVVVAAAGAVVATHGHPFRFASREWRGFSHSSSSTTASSHFASVGSGRYDIWRVALDAFRAHPIEGLGQDNFADYYVVHRHTAEEPSWTHSWELRLLAQTGLVGTALFLVFLWMAIKLARGRRKRGGELGAITGIALLPLVVWMIHGSVDWFWEIPALTGPVLAFLAIAGTMSDHSLQPAPARVHARRTRSFTSGVVGFAGVIAAVVVLGFPYLSVREVSLASDVSTRNLSSALSRLSEAAKLDPLSADPGRIGGSLALLGGLFTEAERRYAQATAREPGGWFSWLGEGLAASALGDTAQAKHDFEVAASINSRQPGVTKALALVDSTHPLTPRQAFELLVITK